jgi:hypothetical protein
MNEVFSGRVIKPFRDFVNKTPKSKIYNQGECLADYIYSWVKFGGGDQVCDRDFTKLQIVSLIIANHWCYFRDAMMRRNPVETIFMNLQDDVQHPIFDPSIFI